MNIKNSIQVKVGSKKVGSYIDFIKHNPVDKLEIMARGLNASKAVYISGVMKSLGYKLINVEIDAVDMGKKEPLAVINILMRAEDVINRSGDE